MPEVSQARIDRWKEIEDLMQGIDEDGMISARDIREALKPVYESLVSDIRGTQAAGLSSAWAPEVRKVGALYLRKAADRLEALSYNGEQPSNHPNNIALRIAADQLRGWADQEEKQNDH
jgi:hypothetical protein